MLTGRAMRQRLASLGIPVQKVVRKQRSGDYVADFFVPNLHEPIAPSNEWAHEIRRRLPDVAILETHDTIADWRPGRPVIHATVVFRLSESSAA